MEWPPFNGYSYLKVWEHLNLLNVHSCCASLLLCALEFHSFFLERLCCPVHIRLASIVCHLSGSHAMSIKKMQKLFIVAFY